MALKLLVIATFVMSLILAAAVHFVWLVSYVGARCMGRTVAYGPFGWTALSLVVIVVLVMLYGVFVGRWKYQVTQVPYSDERVPEAFDGYRIVHISDMHLSTYDDNNGMLDRIVDMINALEPDLVCFTGDMVSLSPREWEPYSETLKRLHARDGVVSVLGNHDFFLYSIKDEALREAATDSLVRFQRDVLGWKLLRNEHFEIARGDQKITILGVDNTNGINQGFKTIAAGDLSKAMEGTDGFRILLTHDPSHWNAEVVGATDIPLTLSGHTHAAQIRLFGWTPASWMFRQTDGRYDIGSQTLYINIGLGCTAPVRLGANPEITLITLEHSCPVCKNEVERARAN